MCSHGRWKEILAYEKRVLAKYIIPGTTILDAGCGYGRLIECLPDDWRADPKAKSNYFGIDYSPDFIAEAKRAYPGWAFGQADLRLPLALFEEPRRFDFCVVDSVRGWVSNYGGGAEEWRAIETNLLYFTDCILFLEFGDVPTS